jgi:hypothetical protein
VTPRDRVESALRGQMPDVVPFTIYANKLPRCQVEHDLRNAGICILERSPGVVKSVSPNVRSTTIHSSETGAHTIKTIYETPGGIVETVDQPAPGTVWKLKRPFNGPEDYKPVISMIRDRIWTENYAEFIAARDRYGDGTFLRAGLGYSPLQEIIYMLMGVERFSIEWSERRDDLLEMYDALTEERRQVYPLIADSPAVATNYGGNVCPEIVGRERFQKYILPHYNEAAEIINKSGGLLGVHFDGNTKLIAEDIADSQIDYIEALSPPPDCDMSVAEARETWQGKVLWLNFPSSVHHMGVAEVERLTREILSEAAPGEGFIFGISEDVPDNAWPETFPAIARVISDVGQLPLSLAS